MLSFLIKEIMIHVKRTIKLECIQINTLSNDVIHNVFSDAHVKSTDILLNNVCFYELFKIIYPDIKDNL